MVVTSKTIGSASGAGKTRHGEVPSIQASSSRSQLPTRPATSMNYYPQSTAYGMPSSPPPIPSSSRRTPAPPGPFYEDDAGYTSSYQSSSQHMPSMPPPQQPYQTQSQSMYPQSTYTQSTYPQSYNQPSYSQSSSYHQPTYSQPQSTHSSSMYAPPMQAPPMPTPAQPPPMQYQYQYPSAAAASRSQHTVLPPLQQFDGYMTDTGMRERDRVRVRERERERERRHGVQLPAFSEITRHQDAPNEDVDPRYRRYHQVG